MKTGDCNFPGFKVRRAIKLMISNVLNNIQTHVEHVSGQRQS